MKRDNIPCANCKLRSRYDKNPKSLLGSIKYIQDAYLQLLIDIDYNQKLFYMIKDVIEALAEREQQTSKYPTMYDFMIKQAGLCEIHDRGQKRNVPFCSADVSSFQTATNAINIPFFMNR